jgi:type VI secretion system secreted protein Hcp
MAVDGFLKFTGPEIKGESRDKDHKDEIDILDIHFALNQPASMAYGGGGGTGKADFHDISLTKRFDFASPTLMGFCARGDHIDNGVITLRKAGGEKPLDYLTIKLEHILISSLTPSGLGSGDGMEHLTLNFAKITMLYDTQTEKGAKDKHNEFMWDNKAHEHKKG